MKKFIEDINLVNKKVLVRVDFNVPMKDGIITSLNRIEAALPTIKRIISQNGKVILFSHLGKVKKEEDLKTKTLAPVAQALANLLKQKVIFVPNTRGQILEDEINNMKPGEVLLVENTRFEDFYNSKAESSNAAELGYYWASLGNVFINDAFGTAHRAHASNVGIASNIRESAIGYLMKSEVDNITKAIENPRRPYIAIIGGAKVSDKIDVLEKLAQKVDYLLIGGAMSYTFNKALGHQVGLSMVEDDKLDFARDFYNRNHDKVILSLDSVCNTSFSDEPGQVYSNEQIPSNKMGLDIGPRTINTFVSKINMAKTIIWNGPLGVTEFDNYKNGTYKIASAIAALSNVYSLVGGGDSVSAIEAMHLELQFSHVSTGGGATLELIEGKTLPGYDSIQNK